MKTTFTLLASAFVTATVLAQAPTIQWQNTIGGSLEDYCTAIQQTTDGGYIVGGFSYSSLSGDKTENRIGSCCFDYWIIKTDASGNMQWQNTIGGNDYDRLTCLQQTTDGGYILGGSSKSNISADKTENNIGDYDYWIVKTDDVGTIMWQNTIGGSALDELNSIQQTTDGGFILAGHSLSNISGDKTEYCIGNEDYWIVKTDPSGNIQWQNTIGGSESDKAVSIQQTTDGGYIIGGRSRSNISGDKAENSNGLSDYWIVKIDDAGNIQWQNTIGGSSGDNLRSIKRTTDGGYILGGTSISPISGDKTEDSLGNGDYWVVRTDASGAILWQNTIGGSDADQLESIHQTNEGEYLLGGISLSNISGDKTENCMGNWDIWIIKIDTIGNIIWQNTIGGSSADGSNVTPEPLIELTLDGGFILGSFSDSNISGDKTENSMGLYDYWIIKLAPDLATTTSDHDAETRSIFMYPNPATREVRVGSSKYNIESAVIFNSLGEEVHRHAGPGEGTKVTMDVSGLIPGIYMLRVGTQAGTHAVKLVVE